MKKEIILKYEGVANENLLIFIINQLKTYVNYTEKSTKNKLIHIAIELINNLISHSDRTENCKIECYRQQDKLIVETQNYYKGKKFMIAQSKLANVGKSKSIDRLIQNTLKKSLPEKSSHLGIIKIYEKTSGNFKIRSKNAGKQLLFTTKSTINEKN